MSSIRTRMTGVYGLALFCTMVVFAVTFSAERTRIAKRELADRAKTIATLAARLVEQSGVMASQVRLLGDTATARGVDTTTIIGTQFTPRFVSLLNVLPEYVVITDSMRRVVYVSAAARALTPPDSATFMREVFALSRTQDTREASLEHDRVLLAVRFEDPDRVSGVRRIVAGVSMRPMQAIGSELIWLTLVIGPLILIASVVAAWALAGGVLQPIARMVDGLGAITDGRSLHRRVLVEREESDEIGRLGDTVNAMIARLEASFAALRRFTADASHELKTPLAVLRVDVERAMNAPHGSMEQAVALEEALQQLSRMTGLVESLLTLARADEGRYDLTREPVALEPLVREVAETAQILGEEAGLTVTLPLVQPLEVLGDTERLRQLFLNLVTNAIKYTPKGGSVDLSLERRNGEAVFTVKDTGVGIAGADLPFIFDRFWRVDRARTRGAGSGVGLGLSISQWIAHAHGGSIEVSSRLGRGSTFTVLLPMPDEGNSASN